MATLLTSNIISKETLMQVENALILGKRVDSSYSDKFGKQDAQIGTSYDIRRPILSNVQVNNMAYVAANANVTETKVSIALGTTLTTPMSFSDTDLAFKIEKFSDRFVKPATTVIAARVDSFIADAAINAGLYGQSVQTGAGWVVGTYGTALTTQTILTAKQLLLDAACPDDGDIYGILSPKANAELAAAQVTLFNAQKAISDIYSKGYIGEFAGVEFSTSQSLVAHTNGAQGTLAIGAGSAVLTAGWAETGVFTVSTTTGIINAGDVFTVAGVYQVNPLTKAVTSNLAQFTAVTSAAVGSTSVAVSPAPIIDGEYKNISTTVASKTATLVGATGATGLESLMFHKKAIAFASPELVLPKASSFDMAEYVRSEEVEFGIRFLRGYDMVGASGAVGFVSRLDTIFGVKIVRPEWIVRIRD